VRASASSTSFAGARSRHHGTPVAQSALLACLYGMESAVLSSRLSLFLLALALAACNAGADAPDPSASTTSLAATAALSCDGSPTGWRACRGSGCWVCSEMVKDYPAYFINHPSCTKNDTCAGQFYACSDACPAPTAEDAICPTGAAFRVTPASTFKAVDIGASFSVKYNQGEVDALEATPVANGYRVFHLSDLGRWQDYGGAGARLAVAAQTFPIVFGNNGAISYRWFSWKSLPNAYGPVNDIGASVTSVDVLSSGTPYYLTGGLGLGSGPNSWLPLGSGLSDGKSISVFGENLPALGNDHWATTQSRRVVYLAAQGGWTTWGTFANDVADIAAAGTTSGSPNDHFAFIATGATPAGAKVYRINRAGGCMQPLFNSASYTQITATRLAAQSPTKFWFLDSNGYVYSAIQ